MFKVEDLKYRYPKGEADVINVISFEIRGSYSSGILKPS